MHISNFALQEKDHFFLWIPVLLAAGIAFYFGMTTEIPVWMGLTCLAISGVTTYYLRHYYIVFLSSLIVTIVFAGFSCAQLRTYYVATNILPYSFGPAGIQGRIVKASPSAKGIKLTLDNLQISRLRANHVPTRLRLHVNTTKSQVKVGQWVKARAMLKPPPAPSSPGGFDFQRHAYFQQIGAIGFSYGGIEIIEKNQPSFLHLFDELRSLIQVRIQSAFDDDHKVVESLAIAFLTGNKQVIDEETHEAVRAAGLAHLLAISGLHIGLVSTIVFFVIRFTLAHIPYLALRYPIKKWAAFGAIFGALFFTLLTGASVPTIRAFIMCTIVLTGVLLDRKAISLRTVAWAAIVILMFFPESLLGASFQLSFAAVIALVAFYENRRIDYDRHASIRYVREILNSSLIASCATMPFAAYHFNRITLWGIGANLLAIPLTVFWIMPLGLLSLALMPFGLESYAFKIMGWGIDALLWVAKTTAALPYAQVSIPAIPTSSLIIMTLGGLMICFIRSNWRYSGAGLISLALILSLTTPKPDILILPDGKLSALYNQNNNTIAMSQLRHSSYVRDNWVRRWGEEGQPLQSFDQKLACDQQGCSFTHKTGKRIVFNKQAMALEEDCLQANLLITPLTSPTSCVGPDSLIDAHDLNTKGAHAVYVDENDIHIVSVKDQRGQRPWTVYGK